MKNLEIEINTNNEELSPSLGRSSTSNTPVPAKKVPALNSRKLPSTQALRNARRVERANIDITNNLPPTQTHSLDVPLVSDSDLEVVDNEGGQQELYTNLPENAATMIEPKTASFLPSDSFVKKNENGVYGESTPVKKAYPTPNPNGFSTTPSSEKRQITEDRKQKDYTTPVVVQPFSVSFKNEKTTNTFPQPLPVSNALQQTSSLVNNVDLISEPVLHEQDDETIFSSSVKLFEQNQPIKKEELRTLTEKDKEDLIEEIEAGIMAAVIARLRDQGFATDADERAAIFGMGVLGLPGGLNSELAQRARQLLEELTNAYQTRALKLNQATTPLLPNPKRSIQQMFDRLFRLGKLQPLLDDPTIEEVKVNAPDSIWVIVKGQNGGNRKVTSFKFRTDEEVLELVKRVASVLGRRVDEASPILDLQLPGGERLNAVIPPITPHVTLTIRKHSDQISSLEELVRRGTMTLSCKNFLSACVKAHQNILVTGGTGCGKTSLLNCLGAKINRQERAVIIEETSELQIHKVVEDAVTLQTRPANIEGNGEVTLWQLVKSSLRMRPNWLVLGEIRGSEAMETLLAISSGHAGMCTLHASDPYMALERLAFLAGMSRESPDPNRVNSLIAKAINIVVHLKQEEVTGKRYLNSIIEVVGYDNKVQANEIFGRNQSGEDNEDGELRWTNTLPKCLESLRAVGLDWEKHIKVVEERLKNTDTGD